MKKSNVEKNSPYKFPENIELPTLRAPLAPQIVSRCTSTFFCDLKIKILPPLLLNMSLLMVRNSFNRQTEQEKASPLNRFWPKPKNLQEMCLQEIASRLIRQEDTNPYEALPELLRKEIDTLLTTVGQGLQTESTGRLIQSLGLSCLS